MDHQLDKIILKSSSFHIFVARFFHWIRLIPSKFCIHHHWHRHVSPTWNVLLSKWPHCVQHSANIHQYAIEGMHKKHLVSQLMKKIKINVIFTSTKFSAAVAIETLSWHNWYSKNWMLTKLVNIQWFRMTTEVPLQSQIFKIGFLCFRWTNNWWRCRKSTFSTVDFRPWVRLRITNFTWAHSTSNGIRLIANRKRCLQVKNQIFVNHCIWHNNAILLLWLCAKVYTGTKFQWKRSITRREWRTVARVTPSAYRCCVNTCNAKFKTFYRIEAYEP